MEPLTATAKTKALIAVSGWKGERGGESHVAPYMLCKSYLVWVGVFLGLEAAVLLWRPLLLTATSFTVMYAILQFTLFFILSVNGFVKKFALMLFSLLFFVFWFAIPPSGCKRRLLKLLLSKIELHFKEIGPSAILRSLDPSLPRSVNEGNHHVLGHENRGMPLICGNINFPSLRPPVINGRNLTRLGLTPHRMLSPSFSNSDSEAYSSPGDQSD